jgi:putative membrane protein
MKKYYFLIILFIIGVIISGISPHDYFTWFMEIFPAILGFIALSLTFRKFRFTDLTYYLILIHCYILFIGGHYTYAEVPLFNWIRDFFHQSRNNYDKIGHFAQGFIPAFIIREIFISRKIISSRAWLSILTVTFCISLSVIYEFLEWFVAVLTGGAADAFLGTQGYVWDTQSDMLYATIGSSIMVIFFSKLQDNLINKK